ncbi:hypothetical protein HDIA_1482 [Hartmannibacter diazotrophicus]|uniref:Uncharacterized protein n=1 Tax=Hartmannibacter diazotrophicus TaxID=1482074 RepID=A0A2C9D463_9HYPH|nr:hypothetical protein [Hartmannibacter diazotrophicus]SON55023.1 hypothetical protein HDIA_1482 [Hartmannibacter diazotrophicus]
MQYLGGFSGTGCLISSGKDIARVSYDFDSFFQVNVGIISNGEIHLQESDVGQVFGAKNIGLMTDDGRRLELTVSDKTQGVTGCLAHVDVVGPLPPVSENWVLPQAHGRSKQPAREGKRESAARKSGASGQGAI